MSTQTQIQAPNTKPVVSDFCAKLAFTKARRALSEEGPNLDNTAKATKAALAKNGACPDVSDEITRALVVAANNSQPWKTPIREQASIVEKSDTSKLVHYAAEVFLNPKTKELAFALVFLSARDKVRLHKMLSIDHNDEDAGYIVPPKDRFDLVSKRVVLLPTDATVYGSTAQLVAQLIQFIRDYYHAPDIWIEIMAYYALMTWATDNMSNVPYLRWLGEFETGKTRGLEVVAVLCYRPVLAGGASSVATFYRIVEKWGGTLVIDEADFKKNSDLWSEVSKVLNQGYKRFAPVVKNENVGGQWEPKAYDIFGPKVLSTRLPFPDAATESRCITFPTVESKVPLEIPLQLREQFYQRAQQLRNKLLRWRFDHFDKIEVRDQELREKFGSRIAQIGSSLLAVVEDPAARERIINFLSNESVRSKSTRPAAVVLEALRRINEAGWEEIAEFLKAQGFNVPNTFTGPLIVKHVTAYANQVAEDWGLLADDKQKYFSSQIVSGHLKSLGFHPTKREQGMVVDIDEKRLEQKLTEYHGIIEAARQKG